MRQQSETPSPLLLTVDTGHSWVRLTFSDSLLLLELPRSGAGVPRPLSMKICSFLGGWHFNRSRFMLIQSKQT